jgi:membrane protease YdiL (CAAX protease family)
VERDNLILSDISYKVTVFKAIALTIAYFIIGLAIPALINTLLWNSLSRTISIWMNMATIVIFNVLFFIYTAKITGYKVAVLNNITITGILFAIGCAVLFYFVLDKFLDPFLDKIFPTSAIDYQETLATLRQFPATAFIRICLIAPIAEELLMRGYVLTGLHNEYGIKAALLISTALFALLHFNFVQTLSAVICGLVIGILYINTGSLFCCIFAHALYNFISYYTEIVMRS